MKNVFNGSREEPGNLKREGKARIVSTGLDRIYSLPRNPQSIRQLSLAPIALGAQDAELVLHW